MDGELIHDEGDAFGIAIPPVEQIADNMRPLGAGAAALPRDRDPGLRRGRLWRQPASGSQARNKLATPLRT
jgi:hypothetical protein